MDKVFSPVTAMWEKLSVRYHNPCVKTHAESSTWIRAVAPIANCAKKGVIAVAFAIVTLAMGIYSLFVYPYRLYKQHQFENGGFKDDCNRLTADEKNKIEKEIRDYINKKEQKGNVSLSSLKKDQIALQALCAYARSSEIYAPIVVAWVDGLLAKANAGNQKLLFMARDGIAPYKVALQMMQKPEYQKKYPNLVGENKIALAYFSRKVIDHASANADNAKLFQKYAEQLGVKPGDNYIFVDIGFNGSRNNDIRKLLPNVTINFDFLISHTDDATGFMYATEDHRVQADPTLPAISSIKYGLSGYSIAHNWLEEGHQGVGESAAKLIEVNGVVYPDTKMPNQKKYAAKPGSDEYFFRKWGAKAVERGLEKYSPETVSKAEAVKKLDETLHKILNNKLILFVK